MSISKIFRRVVSVLLIIALVLLMDRGIGRLLQPVSYADFFLHDIDEIENCREEVDAIFIGASRTYRTFVPQIFEDKLDYNCVVNAGSSAQPISATYFQLKDLIERIHPKKVFLCVTWDQLLRVPETQASLIVYDRLSLRNKIPMAWNAIKKKEYLSYSYRFKDSFDLKTIADNYQSRKKLIENHYQPSVDASEYYADTGFVYGNHSCETGTIELIFLKVKGFSQESIRSDNLRYLNACFDICQENGIEIVMVSGVTSLMRIYSVVDYQDAVEFYTEYAQSKGTVYYNLNYLKSREDFLPDEMMHDYNHVNGEGAQIVSSLFAEVLDKAEKGEDVSRYFYTDIDELKKDVHRIVTVHADISRNKDDSRQMHASVISYQNDDIETVYRLSIRYDGEDDFTTVSDWNKDTEIDFTVKQDKGFTIRIEAASIDQSIGHAMQYYSF